MSDQVIALSCSWSASRSFMSMGYLFCDSDCPILLSLLLDKWSAHPCLCSLMFLIMSVTPLCLRIQEGDSYHDSLHLPLGCDQFVKLGVAKRPDLTAICHFWECILVKYFPLHSHWYICISHDVVQLAECTPTLSDSPVHFLYLVMVLSHHLVTYVCYMLL